MSKQIQPTIPDQGRFGPWFLCGAATLILFKLWLVSAQSINAVGPANHDDALFINLAHHILGGRWLGPYSEFTLAKGPMYSLFIVGVFMLGIPLFTAQQLLYAGACCLMACALRPLVRHRGVLFGIFTVLLFNPVTYDSLVHGRVLRQNIIHSLVLLILAGLIALYANREGPKQRLLAWAVVTGIALPAFWLTREEGVWLMPFVGLLWLFVTVAVWRRRASDRNKRLGLLILPALMWMCGLGIVAGLNWHYYGIFTTCEFREKPFKDAFGAMMRVKPKQWHPYLPISRESRARMYSISPALAEVRPVLEGPTGEGWAWLSECVTQIPAKEHEMAVGWLMWALRSAVIETGHGHSGAEVMAYYTKVAQEINDACDRGVLEGGSKRSGFVPPLKREYLPSFLSTFPKVSWYFISFADLDAVIKEPSSGSTDEIRKFADLTRGRLTPPRDAAPFPKRQLWLDGIRLNLLKKISQAYSYLAVPAIGVSLLLLLIALWTAFMRRRLPYFAIVSIGAAGSNLAIILMVTLIDISSFPALNTGYFTGGYALWLLFIFTGALALTEVKNPSSISSD